MDFIPQYVFNGLVVGCSYALIAVGLTAIFGLMEIANFAHGQFYMLGAYFSYWLTRIVGLDFWTGLVASIVGVMLLGVILERTLFRLLRGASLECLVCGEFVMHAREGVVFCPECGSMAGSEAALEAGEFEEIEFGMQAG